MLKGHYLVSPAAFILYENVSAVTQKHTEAGTATQYSNRCTLSFWPPDGTSVHSV